MVAGWCAKTKRIKAPTVKCTFVPCNTSPTSGQTYRLRGGELERPMRTMSLDITRLRSRHGRRWGQVKRGLAEWRHGAYSRGELLNLATQVCAISACRAALRTLKPPSHSGWREDRKRLTVKPTNVLLKRVSVVCSHVRQPKAGSLVLMLATGRCFSWNRIVGFTAGVGLIRPNSQNKLQRPRPLGWALVLMQWQFVPNASSPQSK